MKSVHEIVGPSPLFLYALAILTRSWLPAPLVDRVLRLHAVPAKEMSRATDAPNPAGLA